MTLKQLIYPQRLRTLPSQFSWLDQRLVRDRYIDQCDPNALALYLFLVTVADAKGLSYYADASLSERLSLPQPALQQARQTLISAQLIAYQAPLYQVLELPLKMPSSEPASNQHQVRRTQADRPLALKDLLKRVASNDPGQTPNGAPHDQL